MCVRGCGTYLSGSTWLEGSEKMLWLAEMAWDGLP